MTRKFRFFSVWALSLLIAGVSTVFASEDGDLKVVYSVDFENTARACASAFTEETGQTITLIALQEAELENILQEQDVLAFLSKDDLHSLDPRKTQVTVIGREIFIPVMNASNPFLAEIRKTGMSPMEFARAYSAEGKISWDEIISVSSKKKVNAYRVNDPTVMSYLSEFVDKDPDQMGGIILNSCSEVLSTIQSDPLAIGFCTLNQLNVLEKEGELGKVSMIPVDLNNNNTLDHFEQIYSSVEEVSRGIWIGKYSGALYGKIYAVSSTTFSEKTDNLLRWYVESGQAILAQNGYSALSQSEQQATLAELDQFYAAKIVNNEEVSRSSALVPLLIALGIGILLLIVVLLTINTRKEDLSSRKVLRPVLDPHDIPGGYYFDHSHTWTYLEKDGNIRVGVDNFIQHVSGRISKVKMKESGQKVKKGEILLSLIQDGKTMDIKSPLTGTIIESNAGLVKNASQVNSAPYGDGWFYIVKPERWQEEFKAYMVMDKYREWVKSEFQRLKDFVMTVLKPSEGVDISLQEGGEIEAGLMEHFGPEAWEEFQISFLKNK